MTFERFLFAPANPKCVALFRVLLAMLLAFAFWPRGLQPASSVVESPLLAELYGHLFLTAPYRLAMFAGIFLFALGWRPRMIGLVLVCLLLPHDFLTRGQQSRQVLLFTLALASLPPATPLWRWRELSAGALPAGPIWPLRLIQVQLTLLYGINAWVKSSPEFLNGEVLMALSTQPNFLVDLTSGYLAVGSARVPVWLLAVGTVVIEYWLAIGFWIPRYRWPTAVLGVAFHMTLKFVLRIFMLDYVSMLLYLAFLLPWQASAKVAAEETDGEQTPQRQSALAA